MISINFRFECVADCGNLSILSHFSYKHDVTSKFHRRRALVNVIQLTIAVYANSSAEHEQRQTEGVLMISNTQMMTCPSPINTIAPVPSFAVLLLTFSVRSPD